MSTASSRDTRFDAVVVGGGHNGLVAATLLARAGRRVVVLERRGQFGGAATSSTPFPGVGARISSYAYLVSLFPAALVKALCLPVQLRRRRVDSYSPSGDGGVLVDADGDITHRSLAQLTGERRALDAWQRFHAARTHLAKRLFPTLTKPLLSRDELRRLIDDGEVWRSFFEEPLSAVLERTFDYDLLRGLVLTDATIGTFAAADDPLMRQNRCFLYHVIGNGTGRWDVPVGGMGALANALLKAARPAGALLEADAEVVAVASDGTVAEVTCADGRRFQSRHVLANVAPSVLSRLLGEPGPPEAPEGSQLKMNMLLARLPRLRDPQVAPELAFAGTFHVNEGYDQLQRAYEEATRGRMPAQPPCELYCHSLTDASILSPELQAAGAHALTLFALHMPARLFRAAPEERKRAAVAATIGSVNSVLAEPLEGCLWRTPAGEPCIEALTPLEIEQQLAMPGGHIFHRDLAWPYAEQEAEPGQWGVETEQPNVWICGAGARRGGGVSGIPGFNAAQAVLAAA